MTNLLKILAVFFIVAGFFFVGCDSPKTETISTPELLEVDSLSLKVDEYFTALTGLWKFNGVVNVTKNGSSVLLKEYECSFESNQEMEVSIDSQFDIHSISKLMAKFLFLMLEDQEKLNRNDVLSDYFSDFPRGDEISLQMILNHTSGLPREFENIDVELFNLEKEGVLQLARSQKLLFEPGTSKQYSNIGYQLLYMIIGDVSGKSFEQALIDDLFKPLNMNDSGSHFYSDSGVPSKPVSNHTDNDGKIEKVKNILPDEFKQARIYSTAEDLISFLEHIKNSPGAKDLMSEDGLIGHSGGSDGIRTHAITNVKENYSYVFLSNFDGIPFGDIVEDLEKIMNDQPYDLPVLINRKAITIPHEKLEKYLGTYMFPDMNNIELEVVLKYDGLHLIQEGEDIGHLKAESESVFFDDPTAKESFEFIQNDNGEFDALMGWKGVKLKGSKIN